MGIIKASKAAVVEATLIPPPADHGGRSNSGNVHQVKARLTIPDEWVKKQSFDTVEILLVGHLKTKILFSGNSSPSCRRSICGTLGFNEVASLGNYLGVPLLNDRVTSSTYRFLIEKLEHRLVGWKARSLSFAGIGTSAEIRTLEKIDANALSTAWRRATAG